MDCLMNPQIATRRTPACTDLRFLSRYYSRTDAAGRDGFGG